ncbi:MAG: hypothetical protein HQL45_17130 [Alphaproteobacteria bacterium]|nr:hypothetical protein [Alphaproteobacteria bacterium]
MTPDQLAKIGVPLASAWKRFGNPEKTAEFERLSPQVHWTNGIAMALEAMKTMDHERAKSYGNLVERVRNIEADLYSAFFQGIRTGRLKAYGYQVPRSVNDNPKEVPKDLWGCEVLWDKSEIEGNGLKMSGVRVVRVDPSLSLPMLEMHEKPVLKKLGRPSKVPLIEEAFNELAREGTVSDQPRLAPLISVVRAKVHALHPELKGDMKGLGEEAIRKTIRPLFEAHKLSHKL